MQNKMMEEGLRRLEILQEKGLWDEVIRVWKEDNKPCLSEAQMFFELCGINYTFDERPELKVLKEKVESELGCNVYYGIYTDTDFGRMVSLLYVSEFEEEWEYERNELEEGYSTAYVWNIDGEFGEIGSIGFKMATGGLVRVA